MIKLFAGRSFFLGFIVLLAVVASTVGFTSPAHASFSDVLFDHKGRNAGNFGWESVKDEVYLTNRAGGVYNIRLIVNIQIDGTYHEYKDTFVPDGYDAKFKFYLPDDAQTVRVRACYYTKDHTYLDKCSQRYDTKV